MTGVLTRYAGLIGAPLVWAVNTQLGQILPHVDCPTRLSWTALVTALAMLIALATAGISYVAAAKTESGTRMFFGQVSVLTALAFAFALFLQGAATLLLDACTR